MREFVLRSQRKAHRRRAGEGSIDQLANRVSSSTNEGRNELLVLYAVIDSLNYTDQLIDQLQTMALTRQWNSSSRRFLSRYFILFDLADVSLRYYGESTSLLLNIYKRIEEFGGVERTRLAR